MRYLIRKEFYGAYCYDKEKDQSLAIDNNFYKLLVKILSGENVAIPKIIYDEGFVLNNEINFEIVENTHIGKTLSSPSRIHFYYTSKCNLNCKHCFTKNINHDDELTFNEKILILDQMKTLGIGEILIGGGEPFFENDFLDFVEESLKRGIVTKVFTNGLLLNDEIIDRISKWNLKYLSISLDGHNEDEYKKVRGVEGIEIIKNNIQKLIKVCSFPVCVSITVNSSNYKFAKEYLKLVKETGADKLKVRPVKPSGNVFLNKSVYLTPENYSLFLKELYREYYKNYKDDFMIDSGWGDTRLYYNQKTSKLCVLNNAYPYDGYGCFAGQASMVIDSKGNTLPCGFLPKSLTEIENFNIKNKTIKEIWDTNPKFLNLRKNKGNETCKKCKYFGTCRGGCIARILFSNKKMNEQDPWCLRKYFPIDI